MSSSSPAPARGVRIHWDDLPAYVRAALELRLGARVVEAITQPGGFSPGLAARVVLEDGRRAFVKAVHEGANPDSPNIHRREARIVVAMPSTAPVPRFLWGYDEDGWVALCFEDVEGRHPAEPWTGSDLHLVVEALRKMARALTPTPIDPGLTAGDRFRDNVNGWRRALENGEKRIDQWVVRHLDRLAELEADAPAASAGDTLLHFDTRADNILIAGDRVYVVDWPWACTGAAWVDWVAMAPSVAMQGGPDPESFLRRFDVDAVSARSIDAVLCSIAGFFVMQSLEPAPPGLPTLRAFQAAQGGTAVAWLRDRLGWD
ncbi:MAG TPA: aminoglycoside phosphotransferase family protein [Candidatus Dormibacteraeota bacterium]|nr:aminoglycoside phosphotransferase family protein [Candidatus Dormibacteraeota bacterium]